jgi:PAS domain S-box-containing protein
MQTQPEGQTPPHDPEERQPNTPARPPALRSDRLSVALCFGAIAIGVVALIGYGLGNSSIAALSSNGKPVSAVTALAFIVLGVGVLALRSPAGQSTARCAALGVIVLAAADLLSAALSPHIEEWQMWAARGGVNLHPYPITSFLLIASASALVLLTTRRDFAGHLIASAVLLICAAFLLAYFLKVPAFIDPLRRVAPVVASTFGFALISAAELLARPRGWIVPLLSRTSVGLMSRLLLPAAIVIPFLAHALRDFIADARWFTPELGLTVIASVNVFFSAAIVLGAGVILHKRESDRVRLAAIVDASSDAIIGTSSAGLIESWNAGAERMYGYTAAEAIGRPIAMLAPREVHDEVPLLLERLRRGERVDAFETVRVAKDGRHIDALLSLSPILDDGGNVVGVSAIAHDVTERKKAEEVIRRQAEQYATVLATSLDGFWLVDLEGRLLDVNDAYCRMSGYSREELLELRIGDLEAIETSVETASHIRSVVGSGVARFETKHRTKDNRILDIEISVSLWRAAGQMLVFARDITRRVTTEQALRDSEAALAEAQEIAHIGSWILSPELGEGRASAEAFRIFAMDPRPTVTVPLQLFLDQVHVEDRARVEAAFASSIQTGTLDVEARIVTPQGTRVAHAVARQRKAGEPRLSLIGTIQDITELKAAEEALRQHTESLERSNLELERFNRVAVGRELRMIELKRQINDLCAQSGQPPQYGLPEERASARETS